MKISINMCTGNPGQNRKYFLSGSGGNISLNLKRDSVGNYIDFGFNICHFLKDSGYSELVIINTHFSFGAPKLKNFKYNLD